MIYFGKRAKSLMPAFANVYITLYLIFLVYAKKDVPAHSQAHLCNYFISVQYLHRYDSCIYALFFLAMITLCTIRKIHSIAATVIPVHQA